MRILFCGGGTAGHITPAIAIAEEIMKDGENEIAFVGRCNGMENNMIEKEGYKLYTINAAGLSRSEILKNLKVISVNLKAFSDSKRIIKEFKPDIVFGTGGYVCLPVLLAAKALRLPIAMHESNGYPGLVTRLIGKRCTRLFTGYDIPELKNSKNVITTGNPTRKCFGSISKENARKKLGIPSNAFTILSVGGSGGSEKMNEAAIDLMKRYSLMVKDVYHIHSTGEKYFGVVKKKEPIIAKGTPRCKILPFIFNMNEYLAAADVIITRCGAITLSEIAVCGTIPILIPSPNVTDNHQYKNAKIFSDKGAGILIEENSLSCEVLIEAIEALRVNKKKRAEITQLLKDFSSPDATYKIISEISKII